MKKKSIRLLVVLVSIIIIAIGVLNTPSFSGNYLKSSFTNKIVLENSRKEKNKPTIWKPIQFTQEYGEEGLNSKEIYELNNKHIIYIKTYKNKMFYPIHYIPDEECYLNIYGEYIIVQNIAVYFKNKWHGLGLNAPLSQIVDKNCKGYKSQIHAYIVFYPTEQKFNVNNVHFEFYSSRDIDVLSIIKIVSNDEEFALIRYYCRFIEIDEKVFLDTIINNLIIV